MSTALALPDIYLLTAACRNGDHDACPLWLGDPGAEHCECQHHDQHCAACAVNLGPIPPRWRPDGEPVCDSTACMEVQPDDELGAEDAARDGAELRDELSRERHHGD